MVVQSLLCKYRMEKPTEKVAMLKVINESTGGTSLRACTQLLSTWTRRKSTPAVTCSALWASWIFPVKEV
jgi:hypothetical protein